MKQQQADGHGLAKGPTKALHIRSRVRVAQAPAKTVAAAPRRDKTGGIAKARRATQESHWTKDMPEDMRQALLDLADSLGD